MSEQQLNPFAEFTIEEWQRAFEIGGNDRETAAAMAAATVAGAADSNGYSIDAELWALLALVSTSCARRVRAFMTREPEVIRQDVERRIRLRSTGHM